MKRGDSGELLEFNQERVALPFLTGGGAGAVAGVRAGLVGQRREPAQ